MSLLAELAGDTVQLGRGGSDPAGPSHVFVDGVVDGECPLTVNGGGRWAENG